MTPNDDRVLAVQFLRPGAPPSLTMRERQTAERLERQSAEAVRQVRREMAAEHRRLWVSLDRLKEQTS